jgi:hypothetical protein
MALVRKVIDHVFSPETFYIWPESVDDKLLNDIGLAFIEAHPKIIRQGYLLPTYIAGALEIQQDIVGGVVHFISPSLLCNACQLQPVPHVPARGIIIVADSHRFVEKLSTPFTRGLPIVRELDFYGWVYNKTSETYLKSCLVAAANRLWQKNKHHTFTSSCRDAVSTAARRAIYSLG